MDLSIIIVNWNSLPDLRPCLASVYRETRALTFEVIVVDNASAEDCGPAIRQEFPGVIFYRSGTNLGFGRANNLGFALSSGELILFLNPDTEIGDDVFARMAAHLLKASSGAVGPCLLNTDGSIQTSCVQVYPTIANQLLDSSLLRRMFPRWRIWGMEGWLSTDREAVPVDAISGACFMVRRRVFEAVGLFTDTYFMYGEDLDLSYKIFTAGFGVEYLPKCRVTHHGGRSSAQQRPYFASLRQKESLLQFFRLRRSRAYAICYVVIMGAAALVRMALIMAPVPLGPIAFRGQDRGMLFRKWLATLRWAAGKHSALGERVLRAPECRAVLSERGDAY
jgi:N-acetylglucosaminyl-diphospho-decaprenol L-rhamnosyltransferase